MAKRSIESRAQELLTRAREVEANNAIYGPGGSFARLFPTRQGPNCLCQDERKPGDRPDHRRLAGSSGRSTTTGV